MPHFTYILFSEKANKYYIGSSHDVEKRLGRHNAGATVSTKSGRPWELLYVEEFDSKTEALNREIYLKRMKSRASIEKLIKENNSGNSAGCPSERKHPGGERVIHNHNSRKN